MIPRSRPAKEIRGVRNESRPFSYFSLPIRLFIEVCLLCRNHSRTSVDAGRQRAVKSTREAKPLVIRRVAACAMKLGAPHLADYGATRGRLDLTQRQLMACLVLRAYSSRTIVAFWSCWASVRSCARSWGSRRSCHILPRCRSLVRVAWCWKLSTR